MHGGIVSKNLPSRPNLDHLRGQAKTLLASLRNGDVAAARSFIEHLPEAKRMKPASVAAAGFRLADAQAVVARRSGFAGWPALSRYVQQLRGLEGEWHFDSLEVEGERMPAAMLAGTRLLIDGDRFRTESPEADYDGVFTIDVESDPPHIDIAFIEGPEAGNSSYGLYELDGDRLTLCLSLVGGAKRPTSFATTGGSGHALERLHRAAAARPANVTGGSRQTRPSGAAAERAAPAAFDVSMTPMLRRLEGVWTPVELTMDGKPMPAQWLAYGSRTVTGNEVKVVFGGQTMVHAKVRIDESVVPIAVDYLDLKGRPPGAVTHGILEWIGDEIRIVMAGPGEPRPADFETVARTATLSRWRRAAEEHRPE